VPVLAAIPGTGSGKCRSPIENIISFRTPDLDHKLRRLAAQAPRP
jgi:hypothetical protein